MRNGNIKSRAYGQPLARLQTDPVGESMTRQDQADMVNINKIYEKTQRGEIVLARNVMPTFDDFSNDMTYDVMLDAINEAEEAFMKLPSEVRQKYNHDPAEYYKGVLAEAEEDYTNQLKEEERFQQEQQKQKDIQQAKKLLQENQNSD